MNSHYFFKIFFKPENEPNKWLKDLYSEKNFCRSFIKQPQSPRIKIDPKNHLFKFPHFKLTLMYIWDHDIDSQIDKVLSYQVY